jgi:hypothetical protein
VNPEVSELRREICARERCEFLDTINYADNCSACPNGHFGRYSDEGCKDLTRVIPPAFEFSQPTGNSDGAREARVVLNEPGDLLAFVIHKLTGAIPCGDCLGRKQQMNEWGWIGCMRNHRTIVKWLSEEAERRGHKTDQASIFQLFRVALREARKRK